MPGQLDKSYIVNEKIGNSGASNLSNSVPDVGAVNSGKNKEPIVLMVEPYSQSGEDGKTISKNNEKR